MSDFNEEERAQFEAMKEEAPAVEVEQKAAPVESEDSADDGDVAQEQPHGQERQRMVPHGALHEERTRRKAAEQNMRELRERLAYFEGQRAAQQPQATQQKHPEQDFPDPEVDPISAIKAQQQFIREQQEARQREQQHQQVARQQQEFVASVNVEWDAFKKVNPDADEAYKHLRTARARELTTLGYAPAQVNQLLNAEELQAMLTARRSGRNIGEYVTELAQYRGWQRQQQPQVRTDGQAAAKSLSGMGSSPSGPMSVERLAAMSEAQFIEYQQKNPATVRRLMGG